MPRGRLAGTHRAKGKHRKGGSLAPTAIGSAGALDRTRTLSLGRRFSPGFRVGTAAYGFTIELGLRVLGALLGVAATALLARAIGPSALAYFSIWTTVIGTIATVQEMSRRQAMLAELSADETNAGLDAYAFQRAVLAVPAAVVCIAIALTLGSSDRVTVGVVMALTLTTTPLTCLSVVLHARMRGDLLGRAVVLQSLAWTGGLAVVCVLHLGLTAVAYAFAAAQLVLVAAILRYSAKFHRLRFRVGWWRPSGRGASAGVLLTVASIGSLVAWKVDLPVVYGVSGSTGAGMYAASYRVLDQLIAIPTIFAAVYTARLAGGGDGRRMIRWCLALTLTACALATLFSGVLAGVLFGDAYAESAGLMRILIAALPFVMLRYVVVANLIFRRSYGLYALLALGYLGVSVIAVGALAYVAGPSGAAVATVVGEATLPLTALASRTVRGAVSTIRGEYAIATCAACGLLALSVTW